MANGDYGHGRVKRIVRPLGMGAIEPDDGGDAVIFPKQVVQGGDNGFDGLSEGDRVRYRRYPTKVGGVDIAEEVIPDKKKE